MTDFCQVENLALAKYFLKLIYNLIDG